MRQGWPSEASLARDRALDLRGDLVSLDLVVVLIQRLAPVLHRTLGVTLLEIHVAEVVVDDSVQPHAVDGAQQVLLRELELPRRPLRESVADAVAWFAREGYLGRRRLGA